MGKHSVDQTLLSKCYLLLQALFLLETAMVNQTLFLNIALCWGVQRKGNSLFSFFFFSSPTISVQRVFSKVAMKSKCPRELYVVFIIKKWSTHFHFRSFFSFSFIWVYCLFTPWINHWRNSFKLFGISKLSLNFDSFIFDPVSVALFITKQAFNIILSFLNQIGVCPFSIFKPTILSASYQEIEKLFPVVECNNNWLEEPNVSQVREELKRVVQKADSFLGWT